MNFPDSDEPVVEHDGKSEAKPDCSEHDLRLRIRQQEILSSLGVMALQSATLDELLNSAARLAADGLEADFSKVLQCQQDGKGLLVVAGVGWGAEVVGHAIIGAELDSPAGFALKSGKPVISNHLENEQRFKTPELFRSYGIKRAVNVILQGDGAPFGVLEVDSRSEGEFVEQDLTFMQGLANILGMAIERRRYEEQLEASIERQEMLLKEVNHRVKNSLQLVASMLRLQVGSIEDEGIRQLLSEAQARVMAVARAHERLYKSMDVSRLDLSGYLKDVCEDLADSAGGCELVYEAAGSIYIETDRAIPLALLVTELATNAAKYAYPDDEGGIIRVSIRSGQEGMLELSVSDEGVGLPADFDSAAFKTLGMRLIRAFAQGLGGTIEFCNRAPGAHITLRFPRKHCGNPH